MAKLYFYYAAMNAGKSTTLLQADYNYRERGMETMLWTAAQGWNTSRDGEVYVPVANQHVWDPEIRAVGQLSNGFQTILPPTASFTTTLRLTF